MGVSIEKNGIIKLNVNLGAMLSIEHGDIEWEPIRQLYLSQLSKIKISTTQSKHEGKIITISFKSSLVQDFLVKKGNEI